MEVFELVRASAIHARLQASTQYQALHPLCRPAGQELLALQQALERAGSFYQQALALAKELGMRPLLAHCHRGLGAPCYLKTGQQEQAQAELSTAIALYRAMDMTFWLPETEAALAQVESQ